MAGIRFGVLGAARIAGPALIEPASRIDDVEITRVAARDPGRARAFATQHGIADVSSTYQALIEADDVDVIYNPLPVSLHAKWTIAALRAGKHVLCEKPFAANSSEAAEMVAVADRGNRILGEAFHYRYHPFFERIVSEMARNTIGRVKHIEAVLAVTITPGDPVRWDYALAGGSTMDLGCYPISWIRHVMGEDPIVISAEGNIGPPFVDVEMDAHLRFPSGTTAHIRTSMISPSPDICLTITGTAGRIVADNPLAPHTGNLLTIESPTGTTSESIGDASTYEYMLRAFANHLRLGGPYPTMGIDSIANMTTIDAMYEAAGLPRRGLSHPTSPTTETTVHQSSHRCH